MSKLTAPIILNDFSSGVIDSSSVSEALKPRNSVKKAINCVFDNPVGSVAGRAGSTIVGDALGSAVKGLFNYRDSSTSANHRLIAFDNSGVGYYLNGAAWTSCLSGDTATLKTRFVTFLNTVARLNGADAVKTWQGTGAWSTSGVLDAGNWPSKTKYAVVFNSRIYTAGSTTVPTTLYYSSIPSGGSISWTSGNGNVDINSSDGDGVITGLASTGKLILVFKERSMYRWNGVNGGDPNRMIAVGTPSNESISYGRDGYIYFFGTGLMGTGIYRTQGGFPTLISQNISGWVEAIPGSAYSNLASYCDSDHYYLSVGDITYNDETYTNCWYVFTQSLKCWHIESRATNFTIFSSYINGSGNYTIVGGDSSGNIQTINSGTTDNGSAISAECELNPFLGTTRSRTKVIGNATAYATYFQGLELAIKPDDNDYSVLGAIDQTETNFKAPSIDGALVRGKRIYPKIIVSNSQAPWQFDGIEFNDVSDEGFNLEYGG